MDHMVSVLWDLTMLTQSKADLVVAPQTRTAYDHKHHFKMVRPYEYRDAATFAC